MFRIIIAFALVPLLTTAQPDQQSAAILKKASETHSAYESLSVKFSYTLENKAANVKDTRKGELLLSGNRFRLQLMGQDVYSDGKIVWYVMKEELEVHVKTLEEFKEETELDPANIFSQYDQGFRSKYHEAETVDGKKLHAIDLFPEVPGKKPYSRIRLGIDQTVHHIVYSKTFGKDGTNYHLQVVEMTTDVPIPANRFSFSIAQYEKGGYDVVDFR